MSRERNEAAMMDHRDESSSSRRDFFRWLTLGGLGLAGTVLGLQSGRAQEKCDSDGVCRRCVSLSDCRLPQALSTRTALGAQDQRED